MAIRYFNVSMRDTKVAESIRQMQFITKASYEWLQAQKQENFSNSPNGKNISMQALIDAGLVVPNHNTDYLDQWGGKITVSPGSSPQYVQITLATIPKLACANLKRQMKPIVRVGSPVPKCDKNNPTLNNYYGEF